MTIPSLLNDTNNEEFKVAWKKAFSVLSSTHRMVMLEGEMPYSSPTEYQNAISKYLSVSKDCGYSTECWHQANEWYALANVAITHAANGGKTYILADGMLLYFTGAGFPVKSPNETSFSNTGGSMYIDVNGFKKPNRVGYDIFGVEYYENTLLPCGAPLPDLTLLLLQIAIGMLQ